MRCPHVHRVGAERFKQPIFAVVSIASEALRAVEDCMCAVAILMHANLRLDEMRPKAAAWKL